MFFVKRKLRRATFCAGWPHPGVWAGAVAVAGVAAGSAGTLAPQGAAGAIPVWPAPNVTFVSSLPRWAKALPSLWITRSISTVTLMLAPLTKPAPVTAFFTVDTMITQRTKALSCHCIAGCSIFTGTGLKTAQPIKSKGAPVLTGVAVETLGASAAACEPVTGAIVLAQAVQGAASPILSRETFFLTGSSCPAEPTGAVAIHVVTDATILTGTCQMAVGAILSLGTHLLTGRSCVARGTGALASPWITLAFATGTDLGTVLPIPALRATFAAVGSDETGSAITRSCHGVTVASVHAFTGILAV